MQSGRLLPQQRLLRGGVRGRWLVGARWLARLRGRVEQPLRVGVLVGGGRGQHSWVAARQLAFPRDLVGRLSSLREQVKSAPRLLLLLGGGVGGCKWMCARLLDRRQVLVGRLIPPQVRV